MLKSKQFLSPLCFIYLAFCSLAASAEEIVYLVVKDLAAPFQLNTEWEVNGGIISDIVDEIFTDTDAVEIISKVSTSERIHQIIAEKNPPLWIAYDAKVWNSLQRYGEFVEPALFDVTHDYLSCQETPAEITGPEALYNKNIAILKGFNYPGLTELANQEKILLTPIRSYEQGFKMIQFERLAGFVEMRIRLKYKLGKFEQRSNNDCFRFIDMSKIIPPYSIYLSISKAMPQAIKDTINSRLKQMHTAGRIKEIISNYSSGPL